jgi:hypothetical protein
MRVLLPILQKRGGTGPIPELVREWRANRQSYQWVASPRGKWVKFQLDFYMERQRRAQRAGGRRPAATGNYGANR